MSPDITMCKGGDCPRKDSCYRFKATPSQYRQSYFVKAPVLPDGVCVYYWAVVPGDLPGEEVKS